MLLRAEVEAAGVARERQLRARRRRRRERRRALAAAAAAVCFDRLRGLPGAWLGIMAFIF